MDVMDTLVDWMLETKYEDLPPEVIRAVKKGTLDTLGVTIAGSSAAGCASVADLVLEWGGKGEASLLVFGGKVPAPNAALVNCTTARALDFGDIHEGGGGHVSETFVPCTLILAEYARRPVTGKEFILALTLGAEIAIRLRLALTTYPGWLHETFAPFGVVSTGGRLLSFDKEHLMNGMAIAYCQCSCNQQANVNGALTVRLQQGLAAKAGVLSTILAQRGITGGSDVLEGAFGFYRLYNRNEYDPARIVDGLGKRFQTAQISLKPYPCCGFTHIPIYAVLQILDEQDIKPGEIEEIIVTTNTKAYRLVALGDNKYKPQTPVDGQFSIPYTVAVAVVRREVFIDDFTEDSIKDPEILEICRRVKVNVDPELDRWPSAIAPNRVELRTKDSRQFSKRVEFVKGHPRDPMTWTECVEKFRKCIPFSAKPFTENAVTQIIDKVNNLEEMEDVRQLIQLLT